MSMSQEEIEALMNGADSEPEEVTEVSDTPEQSESSSEDSLIEDNIDDILAGIDGMTDDEPEVSAEANIDDILAGIDGITDEEPEEASEDNIDDILAGIEGITDDDPIDGTGDNFDDILAGIEGIEDDSPSSDEEEESAISTADKYPMPIEAEHKVVNQLNEVAEDSEEKASQIFDVLSFILDENGEIENYNKEIKNFIEKQIELLESLTTKFPNVEIFKENFELADNLLTVSQNLSEKVNGENNKVFEAMELMQYHDINRQKIERVMAVIRKLSSYLNGIFEDDSDKPEVQIAKHISGDGSDTVDADDIDALISEFSD